jgi:tight adherence protein C
VRAFVRAVVQGEQLGTSLSETLRIQATEARQRRRAAAEERAQKASVKMLLPTAVLIFPALFVFILAPAVLTITRTL